jgi:hypothetical protein
MKTSKPLGYLCGIFSLFSLILMGCGGSSSNSSNTAASAPNLIVYQDSYDFGSVTVGKTATLLVTVSNTGTASLSVDDLTLSDLVNFSIA